ncbi:MAG: HAMP domain-containing sensor histidine kinase [Bacilli bacterium]|nr:HAMP domain-containing sensor histidine kinase [Bacilli bacterium]
MNIKKNSLGVKTFSYLITFSIAILLLLYMFQIVFLKIFYERYQINNLKSVANRIITSPETVSFEQLAYENEMCIQIYNDNKVTSYNVLNKDCLLNSNDKSVIKVKNKILTSSKNSIIRVINPKYDSKSIIYGIHYSDDIYILLNTKLEDVNSTTYILRGQLIYITLIMIILSGIVSYFVGKMINKPILNITNKAKLMAIGNYEQDTNKYDIAEIDELNQVLNYARSEIKNTDELRRDLMANVSHDLKTPLTMIKAYAEMARDINNENEDKRKDNLNVIIDETDRLNVLVNDILELSRMQNSSDELNIESYDLIEELNQILKRYEIIKETENYKFITNIPEKAMVKADKKKINQVMYNLINNAINYTGDDLTIKINITDCKKRYLVEIIDTGKGISEEDLKFIWSKYYKNEKNHKRNIVGTGLGLSIVETILIKHKFEYGVKSKKNKGSNFYFYINKSKNS